VDPPRLSVCPTTKRTVSGIGYAINRTLQTQIPATICDRDLIPPILVDASAGALPRQPRRRKKHGAQSPQVRYQVRVHPHPYVVSWRRMAN
jgi:hypothetical protein